MSDDLPKGMQLAAEPSMQARLAAVKAAENPLLEAAQPLLRALADMPADLEGEDCIKVMSRLLEREVVSFQTLCSDAQIRHEHVVAASYSLCTALDEAANSTAWGGAKGEEGAGAWAGRQLAARFHGDTKGGDKFFLLVGRLAATPQEHIDLLELMYIILGLGFEGRFSHGGGTNARRQLETIRHRLLTLLTPARGDVPHDLSPHWKGVGAGKFRLLRSIPVWVTASLVALALVALFSWYKYQLLHRSRQVEAHIRAVGAMQPPPKPPRKPLRLKELLSEEIARGTVSVDEDENRSIVSFKGDDMFVPGRARLNPKILPVIAKAASEINEVSGTVQVTGHSDNQPIRTREFPDNQVLSEKRADAVAEVLKANGVAVARLKVEGRGATMPIADNATAAGRSRNRRVEIVVIQNGAAAYSATVSAPAAAPPDAKSPGPAERR
ncbi:type VI secretion system protein TssL, long form [Variovorax sp. TBS-050B]|uniref:type VI secretion system protein TssL, long form n=1 Tax=Variovorax sp. TBS-050B TaxID=2940551 RepID=UPI002475FBC4|nr:type VI secretion system protein TssL, long form [Variovorax sp. TBS-050B]